jgi:hypothetical protein
MIVYSVEYQEGRSKVLKRQWFGTEREADDWVHDPKRWKTCRNMYGPNKHVIDGKRGLLSFLRTYEGTT